MSRFLCVVGARPNLTKIAPILRAFDKADPQLASLVHTGQHYDEALSERFFSQLGIRQPAWNLAVGSASHAVQTARVMQGFEPVIEAENPDCVVVVGDVNSTIACALVAAKRGVAVAHVEAGLRSYDRTMPEEINRVLTDQLSDYLFITERSAATNLAREGITEEKVHFVGNVMIDNLFYSLDQAVPAAQTLAAQQHADWLSGYGVVTLHRPSNVDARETLDDLVGTLVTLSQDLPLVWPLHPRTAAQLKAFDLMATLEQSDNISLCEPLGYLELLGLFRDARCVLTDSGGIQEETTALGIPCLTLRHNTERPITLDEGTNQLVGTDRAAILAAARALLAAGGGAGRVPELWDGRAAERIVAVLTG